MAPPSARRLRPPPTAETLAAAAFAYLARYASSEATLRRVLGARIQRAIRSHPDFAADEARQADLRAAIEAILARNRALGLLDDTSYAETRAGSLRRQGRSRRHIAQTLGAQGINRTTIDEALVAADEERSPEDADLDAATVLARRRRLGPYRTSTLEDPAARRKADLRDAGVLARAGFSGSVIRKVLGSRIEDLESPED